MSDKHKPWHDAHRQKSRNGYGDDGKPSNRGSDKPRYDAKSRDRRFDNNQDDERGKPYSR